MLERKQEELEEEFKMLDCNDESGEEDACEDMSGTYTDGDRSPGDGDSAKSDGKIPAKKNQSTQTNMKGSKKQVGNADHF